MFGGRLAALEALGDGLDGAGHFTRLERCTQPQTEILEDLDFQRLVAVAGTDQRRQLRFAGQLRRPPAPFADDQAIASVGIGRADQHRMDQALALDRVGQALETDLVAMPARVRRIGFDQCNIDQLEFCRVVFESHGRYLS